MQALGCTLVMLVVVTSSTHASNRNNIGGFSSQSVDMDGLNRLLESLDSHLESFQKRTCAVGLQSHNCALSDLSSLMRSKAFLSSGYSPGKRSSGVTLQGQGQDRPVIPQDITNEALALQEDVMQQRKVIWRLKHLLQELRGTDEVDEGLQNQKRSCRFRLGGHCLTEELDRAASQFYYLSSPNSPGRRRRSTADTNSGHDVRTPESVRAESESESNTVRR